MKHVVTWMATLYAACSSTSESAIQRGQDLFHSRELSRSQLNLYSCATCHDAAARSNLTKPGAGLAGATLRADYWGGQENDLLRAIDQCRAFFMLDTDPLDPRRDETRALYAFLESLEPGDDDSVPFTLVKLIDDPLPRGDAIAGARVYNDACASCHGALHTGVSRLGGQIPILPEDTIAEHAEFSARAQRLVFIEKLRHGGFLGYGGDMPPFSIEVLSNAQVSDLLEALGVLGE